MIQSIVNAATLSQHRDDPRWVIIDCRHDLADPAAGERQYQAGHIAGARFFHADRDLAGPKSGRNGRHPLPAVADFAATLQRAGISNDAQVVAYDAAGGMNAARLWWMLRWVGHDAVAVLDGGWAAWALAGGATTTTIPVAQAATFNARPRALIVDAAAILARLGSSELTIIDARANDRYRGQNETMDPVAGHIPGALNRPFRDNLTAENTFKAPATLAAEWRELLGSRDPAHVIHSCGSGVSACHNILALSIAGLATGPLYPGSWSEWSSDATRPIHTGAAP